MKKSFQIYYRKVSHYLSYYPEEKIEKLYSLGLDNNFFTQEEAENFIMDKKNERFFEEQNSYFIVKIFEKL